MIVRAFVNVAQSGDCTQASVYASASSERDLRIEKRFLLAARLLVGVAPNGVSCTDSVLRIL